MPLEQGSNKAAISHNIKAEIEAGKDPKQAAAIAYSVAGKDDAPASGIVFRCGTHVLLLQRPDATWGFPGGKIEEGETPDIAARRETLEEIGVQFQGELQSVGQFENFLCYSASIDSPLTVVLNEEHTGSGWFDVSRLPYPLHRMGDSIIHKVFGDLFNAMDRADTARAYDINGWFEVKDNPLSCVGVYQYLGKNIPGAPDPGAFYNVYRPAEELNDPECIESFKLVPWIIDHKMLGNAGVPAEEKGVHGVTGEQIYFDPNDGDGVLKGNIKTFSQKHAAVIEAGKRELSLGYRCMYEYAPGSFKGMRYDYVQRRIRGNHVASVDDGRMGSSVAVMDGLTFTVDAKEFQNMSVKQNKASTLLRRLLTVAAMDEDEAKDAGIESSDLAKVKEAIEEAKPVLEALAELPQVVVEEVAADGDPADPVPGMDEELDDKEAEKKDKEGTGMDAKEIKALIGKTVSAAVAQAMAAHKPAKAMDAADMLREMNARNALAEQLVPFVGVFDHKDMTAQAVAEYGVSKLGVPCEKGAEVPALRAYLHGRAKPTEVPFAAHAQDSNEREPGAAPAFMSSYLGAGK